MNRHCATRREDRFACEHAHPLLAAVTECMVHGGRNTFFFNVRASGCQEVKRTSEKFDSHF